MKLDCALWDVNGSAKYLTVLLTCVDQVKYDKLRQLSSNTPRHSAVTSKVAKVAATFIPSPCILKRRARLRCIENDGSCRSNSRGASQMSNIESDKREAGLYEKVRLHERVVHSLYIAIVENHDNRKTADLVRMHAAACMDTSVMC